MPFEPSVQAPIVILLNAAGASDGREGIIITNLMRTVKYTQGEVNVSQRSDPEQCREDIPFHFRDCSFWLESPRKRA